MTDLSHPTWVCGLKQYQLEQKTEQLVTPYVGVWIETSKIRIGAELDIVTPYVGVWIETSQKRCVRWKNGVTPYVGVWIETGISGLLRMIRPSHPTWVCGLKPEKKQRCYPTG